MYLCCCGGNSSSEAQLDHGKQRVQIFPSELSTEANEKNDLAMLVVNEKALAQGIFLFKKCLTKRFRLECEQKQGTRSQFMTAPFQDLEGRARSFSVLSVLVT